jgi:three-Cys-motif partner protein
MLKIDLAAYKDREQAFVKHCLLAQYLPELGFKVGSAWDALAYVDGFAGPWVVTRPDLSDSSFAIAINCLRECRDALQRRGRNVKIKNLLVEADAVAFQKLDAFAKSRDVPGFGVKALEGEFVDHIETIRREVRLLGTRAFQFVFLDPKGWKDIPMQSLRPLLEGRSSEVLINLMTKHITRFLEEPTRAESYKKLFGRDEVLRELQEMPPGNLDRADKAVREYCKSLHELCSFKYVSQAIIMSPDREEIRYFLVYGTNHHRGVEVFKDAEITAAQMQSWVRHETDVARTKQEVMIFDDKPIESKFAVNLRSRYQMKARAKVIDVLLTAAGGEISFAELFCAAMAFPLVTPDDLEAWLKAFEPYIKLSLAGSGRRRKASCDEDDRVTVVDRTALSRCR